MEPQPVIRSVNIGTARPTEFSAPGVTGIDKRPVTGPVAVAAPAQGSGVTGDTICDPRHHGGPDQAVYAYAAEDLADWALELERELPPGVFGENLTTEGLDVSGALIGERWRIGDALLLEVSAPRIPCRTFQGWLGEQGWVKRFSERARPGAYLRVVEAGPVAAGDAVRVVRRPQHGLDVATVFRAVTLEPALLSRLLPVAELPEKLRDKARRRAGAKAD
ncbi:MOSC domain-containing protein [Kitasatospora acidiphila]|uniref:MOSC domain-containing protein n=1 Tax=Kitasatospora acidiphila TaxID=2567942 RepID=A0A540WEM5_9ACTN|nr:MOSC domain-containing protein [Kitasatospora acidiphila]TQF07483.1 MOSC domain-containing protein [Kitasatospora acidiphila]